MERFYLSFRKRGGGEREGREGGEREGREGGRRGREGSGGERGERKVL